jgi:AraC-like DNA-binding protein
MKKIGNLKTIKPALERINPTFGSSMVVKKFYEPCSNRLPDWHFHPELELVYVNGGSGKRHIGNHISYFGNGDLVFIGSNLPHYGFTDRLTGNKSETVVQMKPDFLGEFFFQVPEMMGIQKLIERAKMGIAFLGETKENLGAKIEELTYLDPFSRLLALLSILQDLSNSRDYTILNAQGLVLEINIQDNNKINKVYDFCRYFKRISGKTFTKFVNEYRLVHASKLLAEKPSSITEICYQSGFNNFSHFNKKFREFTGKSPSAYRKQFKQLVA